MSTAAAPFNDVSAGFAFERIGEMLFPKGYPAGFLAGLFSKESNPSAPSAPRTMNPREQFWDDNTHTDYDCVYIRNDSNASCGGFSAFRTFSPYRGENVIRPQLTVRRLNVNGSEKSPEMVENSLDHELLHLRQVLGKTRRNEKTQPAGAAILYADLANSTSPIVLTPRARRIVTRFMEADAAAKTAWLANVAAEEDPEFMATLTEDSLSAARFAEIQAGAADLQQALRAAAFESMTRPHWGEHEGEARSFGDYYDGQTLEPYSYHPDKKTGRDQWNALRLAQGEQVEFVDIDLGNPADRQALLKIGAGFGPNPFECNGDLHPDFLRPEFLQETPKPEVLAHELELNELLGLNGRSRRGYSEALEAWGVSPEQFMGYATGGADIKPFPFLHARHVSPLEAPKSSTPREQLAPSLE